MKLLNVIKFKINRISHILTADLKPLKYPFKFDLVPFMYAYINTNIIFINHSIVVDSLYGKPKYSKIVNMKLIINNNVI